MTEEEFVELFTRKFGEAMIEAAEQIAYEDAKRFGTLPPPWNPRERLHGDDE